MRKQHVVPKSNAALQPRKPLRLLSSSKSLKPRKNLSNPSNRRNAKERAEELHKKHRVDNIGSYHEYKYGRKKGDEIREIRDCYQQIKSILEDND